MKSVLVAVPNTTSGIDSALLFCLSSVLSPVDDHSKETTRTDDIGSFGWLLV